MSPSDGYPYGGISPFSKSQLLKQLRPPAGNSGVEVRGSLALSSRSTFWRGRRRSGKLGQLKLIVERDTDILALIVRGSLTAQDVEALLPPILEQKTILRSRGQSIRVLVIANSDAETGLRIAKRMTGLRRHKDRLALVVGVSETRDSLGEMTERMPLRVFQRAHHAVQWLKS